MFLEGIRGCFATHLESWKVPVPTVEAVHVDSCPRQPRRADRGGLGNVNDIAECWPNCTANIPEDVWTRMAKGLKETG